MGCPVGDAPGRRVYAVKAHVKDLPNPPDRWKEYVHPQDADGFVWLGPRHSLVASWQDAKVYVAPGPARGAANRHWAFSGHLPGDFPGYPDGAVPGRYALVAFDMVAVGEEPGRTV